ncbi:Pycsar system effector family protein [Robertkochia solimangrovi]|uniref:Pycsar system effector family protein n=1 Tax=Robertkochia solimangrovi TaxID=2213046 RepID=UPI00117F34AA|nr:Pycsar system effector family protein [Robertkochia solimangrovi]TRZ41885.1 phosphohydrolase [Robertkochia solimangrovi]
MTNLIEKTKEYVLKTLNERLSSGYLYHNYNHTLRVVKHLRELIEAESLNEEDAEIVELAGWLHDIGHIEANEGHEAISARMAGEFLKKEGFPDSKTDQVVECIKATQLGIEPETRLQKMIVDADFSHFASENYQEVSDLLREELEQLNIRTYTDEEWLEANIAMFNEHHKFYTEHAIAYWQPVKSRNLLKQIKQLKKLKEKQASEVKKSSEQKLKKRKLESPERGIETMYRVSLRNHIGLSSIADTKANILLSVNAIVISLAISNLFPKLDNPSNAYLIYPTIIFIIFSVTSMILSVLATRPNVTSGQFTKEDVKNKKVNLIFFGNFHKMNLDEFEWGMNEMIKDRNYLYSTLNKDLYYLGKVLDRKYRILRITYTIFMIGIIISVIAFAIAFQFVEN